ncbi:MAG: hypothetical protein GWP08_10445 [Nitrospiraceae bacterium]|nr:hypothetical protein [Nitrospiraceae bacterium]
MNKADPVVSSAAPLAAAIGIVVVVFKTGGPIAAFGEQRVPEKQRDER